MRKEETKSCRRDRRGSTMIEFALGFLVFLMLVLGVFEGGRLVWAYTTLSHATRQAARFAIVHGERNPIDDSAIEAKVKRYAVGLPSNQVTVSTVWEDPTKSGGSVVRVSASYPIAFVASPLVFTSQGLNLTATARGTVAQ